MNIVDEFAKRNPGEITPTISPVQSSKRMSVLQKKITGLSRKIKELEQLMFDIEMKKSVKSDVDVRQCEEL